MTEVTKRKKPSADLTARRKGVEFCGEDREIKLTRGFSTPGCFPDELSQDHLVLGDDAADAYSNDVELGSQFLTTGPWNPLETRGWRSNDGVIAGRLVQ